MTKVNCLVKSGTFVIDVEGHANNSKICTAITMIMQLALIGLKKLAAKYPEHVEVNVNCDNEKLLL